MFYVDIAFLRVFDCRSFFKVFFLCCGRRGRARCSGLPSRAAVVGFRLSHDVTEGRTEGSIRFLKSSLQTLYEMRNVQRAA
jgi:hypothetical protein